MSKNKKNTKVNIETVSDAEKAMQQKKQMEESFETGTDERFKFMNAHWTELNALNAKIQVDNAMGRSNLQNTNSDSTANLQNTNAAVLANRQNNNAADLDYERAKLAIKQQQFELEKARDLHNEKMIQRSHERQITFLAALASQDDTIVSPAEVAETAILTQIAALNKQLETLRAQG